MTTVARSGPIRYATANRFEPPIPVDGTSSNPEFDVICPQPRSRLEEIMGPPTDRHTEGEDCLNLTITSPAFDDLTRPVMVFLHGGGFTSGAGLLAWYHGARLSAEGDVVVVSVNYRLGALGYLLLNGVANFGLYDQIEALRWVQKHIREFGGDPANVTLFGQSSGAISISCLLGVPSARGLFRRVILQSAPIGRIDDAYDANRAASTFLEQLGTDPHTADTSAILEAHRAAAAALAQQPGWRFGPPFGPVAGVYPLRDVTSATAGPTPPAVDVLAGWNLDETTAFGEDMAGAGAGTRAFFASPMTEFATRLERAGCRVHGYRLDWRPTGSSFGATHAVELPLLLGDQAAWHGSPMLGETNWQDVETIGRPMRAIWAEFAAHGTVRPRPEPPAQWVHTAGDFAQLDEPPTPADARSL